MPSFLIWNISFRRVMMALLTSGFFLLVYQIPPKYAQENTGVTSEVQSLEADRLREQGLTQTQANQMQDALESFQQALEIYQEIGDRNKEATTLAILGTLYSFIEQHEEAIAYFQQALSVFEYIDDPEQEVKVLVNLSNAYESLEQFDLAIAPLQHALLIYQQSSDRSGEVETLEKLGEIHSHLKQYEQSILYFQQALTIYQALEDLDGEARTLGNLGYAYRVLGQYPQAAEAYQQSLSAARASSNYEESTDSLVELAEIYVEQGSSPEESAAALETLEPIFNQVLLALQNDDAQKQAAGLLMQWGDTHTQAAQYEEAIEYYQQAIPIFRQIDDCDCEARVLLKLGRAHNSLNQHEKAIQYFQEALSLYQRDGNRRGEAEALASLGFTYRSLPLQQYELSIEYYQQALAIYQQEDARTEEAGLLGLLGLAYRELGHYDQAIAAFQQALAFYQQEGNQNLEAHTLNELGLAYEGLSQYAEALNHHQQALLIFQELGDRSNEATALNGLGIVHRSLKQPEQAIVYYEQALLISQQEHDRDLEANVLMNLGNVYRELDNDDYAFEYYQRALPIFQELGNRAGEALLLTNIGLVTGHPEQAIEYHEQALLLYSKVESLDGEAHTLSSLSAAYGELGQYEQAFQHAHQSLLLFQRIGDRAGEGLSLGLLGAVLTLYQPELAIVFLKESVNRHESIRSDIREIDPALQQSYADGVALYYRYLADLLLQQNRILEAQRVLDLLKVQELDDYLQNVRGTTETETGIELLNAEVEISNRAIAIGYELAQLRDVPYSQLSEAQHQRIDELEAIQGSIIDDFENFILRPDIQELIGELSTDAQEQDVLAQMDEFINLQNNLQALNQNAVLLYPLILDDRLELVLITPFSEPTRYPIDVERTELNEAIVAFRQALMTPTSDPKPIAQQLYSWLIEPIRADLDAIGAETILYAPDGVLRYVPLAALHDGDQWLVERFRINHITAASLQDFTLQPDPQAQILAAAFSEGEFDVAAGQRNFFFTGLPYAGIEVANLADAFPGTTQFLNAEFNLINTERAMDSHTIVHLATHAAFVQGAPNDSFILMGDGDRLTLEYIDENWEGKLNRVNLVVLSACETGVGSATLGNGEEILGFGYLMQKAGAEAAIASLWSVNDGGTQVLMNAFYSALNQSMTKAEALRQAQMALISGDLTAVGYPRGNATIEFVSAEAGLPPAVSNNLNHPYYWAPFILIGNGL